jgi:MFS transporter, OFA family, oxalate/formate antiporter
LPATSDSPETGGLNSRLIDRIPFHYSWVVLGASMIGMAMTIPGQTVGVSVFLDPMILDLGVSRSAVSAVYMIGTVAGSLTLPFVGKAIDSHGPRRSVILIAIGFALACVFMGLVGGLLTLLIGFTLIRGLGQGALGLVSIHTINIWFVRRRGLAVGLAGIGFAVATSFVPGVLEALIDSFDWRWTYALLGLAVFVIVVPVGGGLFRFRPEEYGLLPDSHKAPAKTQKAEVHYEARQARRTLTLWLYITGGFLTAAIGTGLIFHHYSIMAENGIPRSGATAMFVSYGLVAAGAALVTGFLIDRMPPRFLMSGSLLLMVAAMVIAPRIGTAAAVVGYGAVLGAMQGMSQAVQSTVYAHYFGRLHIGAIKGFASTITIAGTAAGPLLLALGFEASSSYGPVLLWTAIIPLVIGLVTPFLPLSRDGKIL